MTCSLLNRFRQAPIGWCVSRFASGFHKVFGWQFTGFSPAIDHPMVFFYLELVWPPSHSSSGVHLCHPRTAKARLPAQLVPSGESSDRPLRMTSLLPDQFGGIGEDPSLEREEFPAPKSELFTGFFFDKPLPVLRKQATFWKSHTSNIM